MILAENSDYLHDGISSGFCGMSKILLVWLCVLGADADLWIFVDSNLAADIDGKKSTTRYVFTLGSATINWVLRRATKNSVYLHDGGRVCCSHEGVHENDMV